MRIVKIKIKNYRQYKSEEFVFEKKNSSDMHIIIASNGVGKTNFLNAITWCLYNEESHLGIQSKSLPILNVDVIEGMNEGQEIDVEVEIEFLFDSICYTAKRTLSCRKNENLPSKIYLPPSKYELSILNKEYSKLPELYYDNEAVNYMNRFLPESINEYFFFDNEQLDSYFINNESETIKTAVKELSQVELLSKSSRHLNEIMNEYKAIVKKNNPDLQKLQNEWDAAKDSLKTFEENIKGYKKQIEISYNIIRNNKLILKGAPNIKVIEEEVEKLKLRIKILENEEEEKLKEIRVFIREYNILIRMYPELVNTRKVIKEQEEAGNLPIEVSLDILKKMLETGNCKFCGSTIEEEGKESIEAMIKKITFSNRTSTLLMSIKTEISRMIEKAENYNNVKVSIWKKYNSIKNNIREIEGELILKKDIIATRADAENLKKLIIENERHENILEINKKDLVLDQMRLPKASEKVIDADKKYQNALDKSDKNIQTKALLQFSQRALDIINESNTEMLEEMKNSISRMTYETFSKLIWKENTYKDVMINDNYTIDLIHKLGYQCIGSCSAAERALLALSFTLSLHKVSGFNAPLVIDSPVGRVSDINRENFGKVLSDVSKGKQIILLFTPSEYSKEIEPLFRKTASNIYFVKSLDEVESEISGGAQ